MTLAEIRKSIARNLNMLKSDNETIMEGMVTKAGIDDEINRIYLELICGIIMRRSPDDFKNVAVSSTYSAFFTVSSIDIPNQYINSSTAVFGRSDEGARIQNPLTNTFFTIEQYLTPNQVKIKETPDAIWIGQQVYVLNNIIVLDGELRDLKEVSKLEIKYSPQDQTYCTVKQEELGNFLDRSDLNYIYWDDRVFAITQVERGDKMERCIMYYPYPIGYDGKLRITYTQRPPKLIFEDDEPALSTIGLSDAIINGVTAWAWSVKNDLSRAREYQENNVTLGGIVPRGLTMVIKNYKPNQRSISTKGFFNSYGN